ncbi:MAG: type II toxin-antitoxin system HicA family toxin [Desulfovibrio sp.]|nr:type II toxin-antitoxin system HicA family toxin [Desulfovibrio sp.]
MFEKVSQKGSHITLRHPDGRMVIILNPKQELPPGTLRNIEKQANITF